jgi:hypothetical protein
MSVYAELDKDVRRWHHYQRLREIGKEAEARLLERTDILLTVGTLRECIENGGFLRIGVGGWELHVSATRTLSGYDNSSAIPRVAECLGIPVLDIRAIPPESVTSLLRLPMIGFEEQIGDAPWESSDFAPLEYVAWRCLELGAVTHNIEFQKGLIDD